MAPAGEINIILIKAGIKMSKDKSVGSCNLCGKSYSRRGMGRHLSSCLEKNGLPEMETTEEVTDVYHLVVECEYSSNYWLHLLVQARADLKALDQYLRDIWLECCGHLSAFTIDNQYYSSWDEKIDDKWMNMCVPLDRVLRQGLEFSHEYDFGSTTHLLLRVLSKRPMPLKDDIYLMARNDPPPYLCEACEEELATSICVFCGMDVFCDSCIEEHACGEDGMLPLCNSPRAGICGYTG